MKNITNLLLNKKRNNLVESTLPTKHYIPTQKSVF